MIVVADTTPLLYLSRIGRLDIARALYVEVLVPQEVYREWVEKRPDADGVKELRATEWIVVVEAPTSIPIDESVLTPLDSGEAAALRLAFERRALVLIDERAGRRAAHSLGLAVRGTLGTLVEARLRGFIQAVAPVLTPVMERERVRLPPVALEAAVRTLLLGDGLADAQERCENPPRLCGPPTRHSVRPLAVRTGRA